MSTERSLPSSLPVFPARRALVRSAAGLLAGLALAACSGGGGGGSGGGPTQDLETSLNRLGVNTTQTPRESAPGLRLDAATSPLGNKPRLSLTNELLLCNTGLRGSFNDDSPMLLVDVTDASGNATVDLLHGQDQNQIPFLPHAGSQWEAPHANSAVVAADADGNGLDEIVFVYQAGIETRVRRYGDETQGFPMSDFQIAAYGNVTNVAALAVDLDLDGKDDLVFGLTVAGEGRITMWKSDGTGYRQIGAEVILHPDLAPNNYLLQLAAGNLDGDAAPEIAVAVQETNYASGYGRCVVLDDAAHGFAQLRSQEFAERDQNQVVRNALTCSIAMGDVDGDGLDEIVLAGLTSFTAHCEFPEVLIAAYDDAEHSFARLAVEHRGLPYTGCNSPTERRFRTVHLHTLDLDGDGLAEIAVNNFLYDDFVNAAPLTEVPDWRLASTAVWGGGTSSYLLDRNDSSFVVGDFTGDDRDDIAVYHEQGDYPDAVEIWSLPATSTTVQRVRTIPTRNVNGNTTDYPMLLPVNVDTDSPVLSYSQAEYSLVFSEPIVIAALAAPPTKAGIGQNTGASFSAFGNTTTTTSEQERSVTLSVGVTVGVNLDGGPITQSEFSLKDTLTVAGTRTRGTAYELSKTILFTSAGDEDLVVFTSVPIDRYTYTILSHPDPVLVGQKVIVDFPRTPVTMQAERGFFNANVPGRAVHVGADVFHHTVGDPTSYPTLAQKNALLGANGGLQSSSIGVPEGGGSTSATIQVGTAVSTGGALSFNYERDLELTSFGAVAGLKVGVDSENSWKITSGQSTSYSGSVGGIPAAQYAQNRYSFGMFAYTHTDPGTGQVYQVLDYWVE